MEIQSHRLGTVEIDESAIFELPKPLLGFDDYARYALIRQDPSLPFAYLQAIDEPGVSFLLADPFKFQPSYEFELPQDEVARLQQPGPEEVAVWVTVSARDSLRDSTMNLLAPIIFNTKKQLAVQVVLHDSSYQTKVPLFPRREEEK